MAEEARTNNTKRKRPQPRRNPIVFWLQIIVVVFGIFFVVRTGYEIYVIKQQQQQLELQIKDLKERNEVLEQERQRLQDPKSIEEVAREELGLVKPGEVPYVK